MIAWVLAIILLMWLLLGFVALIGHAAKQVEKFKQQRKGGTP